jgi:hypothetical protein
MKDIGIYVVTSGYNYEGPCGQWIFLDAAPARAKFDEVAAGLRAGGDDFDGDYVALDGPFGHGDDLRDVVGKQLAYCNPQQEAVEAARAAKRKKPAKPADCYAAMRMADGG